MKTPLDQMEGVLIGTALGDALGLPAENLGPDTIRRRWPGAWRMRLLGGRGMISDDTEHTWMVAQALLTEPKDPTAFQRVLGWKLRWWFAALPGGVGLATARACLKLWLGFPVDQCAVRSGGSGPAMRSAIVGAFFARDPERRRSFTLASSRLTHRGWQAEVAALAVAEAAAQAIRGGVSSKASSLGPALRALSAESEWQEKLDRMESGLARGESVLSFARALGLGAGVSGYAVHVVPVALYAWLRHPDDARSALVAALECGGDTDTIGAIVGALAGATHGAAGMPTDWTGQILEWPRSLLFARRLAQRLVDQQQSTRPLGPVPWCWPAQPLRNLLFLAIVLAHGFRRWMPW